MKLESKNAKKLHAGRAASYAVNDAYDQKFIDPATGRHFAKLTRTRDCPVCGGKKYRELFVKDGGAYVKCETCAMLFSNPVFTEKALENYYTNAPAQHAAVVVNESDFFREIYGLGLSAIGKHIKPGNILDIGCSGGFFLDLARKKGWQTTGTEFGSRESKIAKKKGHRIYTESLGKIKFEEKFSAITMWDVFEHLVDGSAYLKLYKKLLAKDGVIFMQIPNVASLAARVMREKCHMFGTGHVNLYSPETIARLAKKNGYEILYMKTVISEATVLENYLNYEDPYFGGAEFKGKVLGFIRPEDIHVHRLGYKMQIVMRPLRKK